MKMGERYFTQWRLAWVGVFAISILSYWSALGGTPVWDDHQLMDARSFGGPLWSSITAPFMGRYFRPLTALSYWIDYHTEGAHPYQWHFTNIAFHALGAVAVMWLAWVLTERKSTAFFSGILFALQPAQVGAVAWIGGRTDCEAVMFVAVFLGLTIRYFKTGKFWYLPSAAFFFLLAALTKEQTFLLLLAVPVAERLFGKRSHVRMVFSLVAFGVPAMIFAGLVAAYLPKITRDAGAPQGFHFDRGMVTLAHYFGLNIVPTRIGMSAITLGNYLSPSWIWAGLLFWTLSVTAGVVTYRRNREMGWIWIGLALAYLPVSNFVSLPSMVVGPYRTAVAGIFVAILLGGAVGWAVDRVRPFSKTANYRLVAPQYVLLGGAAYLILCGSMSGWGLGEWSSDDNWQATLTAYDPKCYIGNMHAINVALIDHNNALALRLSDDYLNWVWGDDSWRKSLESGKAPVLTPVAYQRLETNVGAAIGCPAFLVRLFDLRAKVFVLGRSVDQAVACLHSSIALVPRGSEAYIALGTILMTSRPDQAEKAFEQALDLDDSPENIYRLAGARLAQRHYAQAESTLLGGLQASPGHGDMWVALAAAQLGLGKFDDCRSSLSEAQRHPVENRERLAMVSKLLQDSVVHNASLSTPQSTPQKTPRSQG